MLTIRSLTLTHVAGVRHAHLEIPDHGVVVIHGPNEAGKSTLLRAIRLLLEDTPTSSRKREVKALKDVSLDEPTTISAEMVVGDHELQVTKAFNKGSGRCELTVTTPRAENFTGRQASDRFSEIVRGEVDEALLEALTVEQGASLDQLAAAGLGPLERALSADIDTGIDTSDIADAAADSDGMDRTNVGDSGDTATLIERIAAERARYFTPGGKPSKELKAVEDDLHRATQAYEAAEAAYRQAQSLITDLEGLHSAKNAVARQEPDARRAAAEANDALTVGKQRHRRLEEQRALVTSARQARELAHQRHQVRAERAEELTLADQAVTAAQSAVAEATQAAETEQRQEQELTGQWTAARRRGRTLGAFARYIAAQRRRHDAATAVEELEQQKRTAQEVSGKIDDAEDDLAANPVTGEVLTGIHRAVAELQQAESLRDAAATTVEVAGPVGAGFTLDGDDHDLHGDGPATVRITRQRRIGLGEFTVTVRPARDVRDADDEVDRAREGMANALNAAGVDSVEHAEQCAEARRELNDALAEHRLALSRATGGTGLDALVGRLRDAVRAREVSDEAVQTAYDRMCTEDPDRQVKLDAESPGVSYPWRTGDTEHPDEDVVLAAAEAAEHEADELRGQLDALARAGAVAVLNSRTTEYDREVARRSSVQESLDKAREQAPDRQLQDALDSAVDAERRAEKDLGALVIELEEASGDGLTDLETLQGLADGATGRVEQLRRRADNISHDISTANGALGEHSGVAERREQASAALQRAERRCTAVRQQAEAADALYQAIEVARDDARRRYEAPYRASVEKLARTLYGRAVNVEFDEQLRISRRVLDATALEAAQLSGGAREQLAILSRLAVADIVGGGEGVPVVIDDALGFSDAARIQRMNLVLGQLGASHQIIVLTCEPARYDSVPGAHVVSMAQLQR